MSELHAKVVGMAVDGMAPADIAMCLGLTMSAVYQHLHKARRSGKDIPTYHSATSKGRNGDHAYVSQDTRERLLSAAQARGISTTLLASKIVRVAAETGLIDGILDDGVTSDG